VKKTVAFIFKIDDKERIAPYGTGFFISVKMENKPNRIVGYFVTARHVLQDESGNFLSRIVLRLNKLNGTATYTEYPINPENIFTHTDDTVDIAVIPMTPSPSEVDYKFIPHNLISTQKTIKDLQIEEGDDVFFTGLFTSYMGTNQNHPILRFGKVALLTDEKIEWKEKGKPPMSTNLYLMECQSFGGNSGSPVFFNLSPIRKPGKISVGGTTTYLAGVVRGSFLKGSEIQEQQTIDKPLFFENIGISAVTPAYKINEILFSNEVIEHRKTAPD